MVAAAAPRPTCSAALPPARGAVGCAAAAAGTSPVNAAVRTPAPAAINRFAAIRSDDKQFTSEDGRGRRVLSGQSIERRNDRPANGLWPQLSHKDGERWPTGDAAA